MKTVQNKSIIATSKGEFHFSLEAAPEVEYVLPLVQDLPVKQVRAMAKAKEDEGFDMVFDLLDSLCPGLTDIATQRDIAAIMEAWTAASNISLGE